MNKSQHTALHLETTVQDQDLGVMINSELSLQRYIKEIESQSSMTSRTIMSKQDPEKHIHVFIHV